MKTTYLISFERLPGDGGDHGRGHRLPVRATVHDSVVGQHVRGHGSELVVRRHVENADHAAHVQGIRSWGSPRRHSARSRIHGKQMQTSCLPSGETATRYGYHAVGIWPSTASVCGVEDGDGIDPHFRHVEACARRARPPSRRTRRPARATPEARERCAVWRRSCYCARSSRSIMSLLPLET